jgi:hypothetical protein
LRHDGHVALQAAKRADHATICVRHSAILYTILKFDLFGDYHSHKLFLGFTDLARAQASLKLFSLQLSYPQVFTMAA